MGRIGDTTFVSSILPWKGSGNVEPWHGENHAGRTRHTLDTLLTAMPHDDLCWGGDWNHSFSGPEYAGSKAGRAALTRSTDQLNLTVATSELPHALDGLLTIDHIAVPSGWGIGSTERIPASGGGGRLSDHDLYVVEVGEM